VGDIMTLPLGFMCQLSRLPRPRILTGTTSAWKAE
jgi:hypothetical protein